MSERSGVILAGGNGSRLRLPYNKQEALVYDRRMIEYPLQTMNQLGVLDPIIVTNPDKPLQTDGLRCVYQPKPNGMPGAIACAEGLVDDDFYVIAGDVYLDPAPEPSSEPALYWHDFEGAANHSVWNPETNEIIEKPARDIGSRAIIFYMFGTEVFDVIKRLETSERGELEMTDIYKWYLAQGVKMREYTGYFADMGTPDGLLDVANYVKAKHGA